MNHSVFRNALVGISVLLFLLVAAAASSSAAPREFLFTFTEGSATATGSITFEDTLLPNPGSLLAHLPHPAILALDVTVTGAASGNGTFGLADFFDVIWNTNGATLDLDAELVGQATPDSPWGTPDSLGGDFNLVGLAAPTPTGVYFFTLGADGGSSEAMELVSFIPEPGALCQLGSGIGGLALLYARRRRVASRPASAVGS